MTRPGLLAGTFIVGLGVAAIAVGWYLPSPVENERKAQAKWQQSVDQSLEELARENQIATNVGYSANGQVIEAEKQIIALQKQVAALKKPSPPPAPEDPSAVLDYTVKVHTRDSDGDTYGSGTSIGTSSYFTSINGAAHLHTLILTCDHVVSYNDYPDDTGDSAYHHSMDGGPGTWSPVPQPSKDLPPKAKPEKKKPGLWIEYHGKKYPAKVVAKSIPLDLAVLEIDAFVPAAPMYSGKLTEGEREIVAGAPYDQSLVLTQGFISSVSHEADPTHLTQQGSAPAYPGNSGGGAYVYRDGKWQLAGVVEAIFSDQHGPFPAQEIGDVSYFSIMSDVEKFLKDNSL